MAGYRLNSGGLLDRSDVRRFTFDGKAYQGFAGDSLASALLASGVTLFGRSFKYHRRRGLFAAGPDEPNALVELRSGARREPNTKAPTVELYDGLEAASQNRWPSLDFDVMGVNQLFSRLFVAGFYYKTFMWPRALWERLYEPAIRRAAGLGRSAGLADPDSYDAGSVHADVLVVGAGPAGLAAALEAGRAGARVVLVEADHRLGGRLLAERHEVDGMPGADFAAAAEAELRGMSNVSILTRTSVFGTYDSGTFGALEKVADHLPVPPAHKPRQRLWTIVARRTVVATGSTERPIVFSGNDTPGVMLAGAVQAYAIRHAAAAGRQIAVFTANDTGWKVAGDLAALGIPVAAVVDPRGDVASSVTSLARGARALTGARVREATGGRMLSGIVVETAVGGTETIACDALAVSGGHQPNIHLAGHLGARPSWREDIAAFGHGALPEGMALAGAANGAFALADTLAGGADAGAAAASAAGHGAGAPRKYRTSDDASAVRAFWHVTGGRGKAFVDFQHDVTASDVALAAREGYVSVEHLKRYTTLGMATDQGRTANLNGLAILSELTRRSIPETGIVTTRPPIDPVAIGAFAGHHRGRQFRPLRLTPTHAVATERKAVMQELGQWMRAMYFPEGAEKDWLETVTREVRQVRSAAGITDMSTLGKIEVIGPDAAQFLTNIYANSLMKLKVGRCVYGVMLREDGFVMDDGTIARIGETHFILTCSTAHAAKVFEHMEFCRQVLWPDLDVAMQSTTEAWAQLALAGPKAREVLGRILDPGLDVSSDAFPFLQFAETTVLGGIRARLFRITFSGELAYEIAVPARSAAALMRAVLEKGRDLGVIAYGIEAVSVMRIEKGHPAGAELSGQVSAHTMGLGSFAERTHPCVGRALALRPYLTDPARGRLVGLKPVNPADRLRAGAHLLKKGAQAVAANDEGYVTSVAYSPTIGQWIGLGYLAHGDSRRGEVIRAFDPVRNGDLLVEVVAPCFIDPEGSRARA